MNRISARLALGTVCATLIAFLTIDAATVVRAQVTVSVHPCGMFGMTETVQPIVKEAWIDSGSGVYRWDGALHHIKGIPGSDLTIPTIQPIGKDVWIGGGDGAYRWNGTLHPIKGIHGSVRTIQPIGKDVWIGTINSNSDSAP